MILGATQSGFKFLQQHLTLPNNVELDFNPHKLISSTKKVKILWAHYAHDQPIFLNVDWLKIDHIVCVSNWQAEQFFKYLKIPKNKISVIRNGGADYFVPVTKKEKTLIYASTPFRGLKYLPQIFKLVLKKHPDAKLKVFSGMKLYGGEEPPEFQKIYNELIKTPNTTYSGPIHHKDLAIEMQSAAILAYPNTWEETSCVTLIEAMRSGVYPVITDIGALPETSNGFGTMVKMDGTNTASGWIPSTKFIAEYANAIIEVLDKHKYTNTKKISTFACNYYDWKAIAKEWEELIKLLTNKETKMTVKNEISTLVNETSQDIVQDETVLQKVFDEVFKWEDADKEHAQGRSNFQIEKFIALDNFTIASSFNAMLKNRRIMAEGLFSKITEMKEKQREFDYKWEKANKSKPIEWFGNGPNQSKKLCWYDLDFLNLQNYLKSSELEIRDRIQQINFFDKILNKLIEQNGGPITREQFEEEDHVYWERRFANQAMDEMVSKNTGISVGNVHSMRRATAPTLVSNDVNRVKNGFPDLSVALAGPQGQMDFMLALQDKIMDGIGEVTGQKLNALADESVASRLDRIGNQPNQSVFVQQKEIPSPSKLFNQKYKNE